MLRSQASAFGSNLSIVQIRQDFSKNLINVLQNGSSNLTLADTNEEAANSQALSTRQSIAVSALALANQSQQSVLQLLRTKRDDHQSDQGGGGNPAAFVCEDRRRQGNRIETSNLGFDLNSIRTHDGHGGENMDFRRLLTHLVTAANHI